MSQHLGTIVRGSLSKGLELKLDPAVPLESLRAGMFAIASGSTRERAASQPHSTSAKNGTVTERMDCMHSPSKRRAVSQSVADEARPL